MNERNLRTDAITSRGELADYIDRLREDIASNPEAWRNEDLASYLRAMAAWIRDMPGYYRNMGLALEELPPWRVLADILVAASMYE